MNNNILDIIKELSKIDTKDLNQKVNKVFEEGGELSKKTLPYTNAHGTLHRFVEKDNILEEVADITLAALSIAYELGFDHEEIENKLIQKSYKWAELQKREARMAEKIPFEIHITIEEANQDKFIETCKLLEVKPIILALQTKNEVIKDVMTSSKCIGSNKCALDEAKRISNGLTKAGFKVLREKIETVPWHTAAPSYEFNNDVMPKDCYFESHFGIKITNPDEQLPILNTICDKFNLHLSRNAFKINDDGSYVNMATFRKYDGYSEDFISDVEQIHKCLTYQNFEVEKPIVEFSIYDTKVHHDSEWLNK